MIVLSLQNTGTEPGILGTVLVAFLLIMEISVFATCEAGPATGRGGGVMGGMFPQKKV